MIDLEREHSGWNRSRGKISKLLPMLQQVLVHGQQSEIYEQISTIITEYITPEESIIQNVLSTSVDFSTCESIRMSQCVDVTGQRTLAVARKQTKIMKVMMVSDLMLSGGSSSPDMGLLGLLVFRIITRVPGISRVSKVTYYYNSTTLLMNWKSKVFVALKEEVMVFRREHSGMESPDGRLASVAQCIKQLRDYKKFILVKNKGVPDLTMVDFRGITRVPVHGQPEDIYEQISAIITEYITPEESIILNVLSTSVDFSTCESIRMSQRVDVTGQRTLAVARKQTKIMKVFRIITRVPGISRVSKVTYNYNSTTLLMNWKSKVKNKGVADLTMVDFRGITRVPVHGKPEDIYEPISTIITEYITPEESIILNVISTLVDFYTCESIRMSQRVDVTGQSTLAVARKQTKIR
ncbi:vacuolar sorting protein VPS1, dynamin [Tanacetum coccineum]